MENVKIIKGIIYYTTKKEVEKVKRKYDRVYYEKEKGYYIVRPLK